MTYEHCNIIFNYFLKNIGLPSHQQYQRRLIEKSESATQRMRWKAHNYGLPSSKSASLITTEMKAFEEDAIQITSNRKFRKFQDPFLNETQKDMKSVNSFDKVMIFADNQEICMKCQLKPITS